MDGRETRAVQSVEPFQMPTVPHLDNCGQIPRIFLFEKADTPAYPPGKRLAQVLAAMACRYHNSMVVYDKIRKTTHFDMDQFVSNTIKGEGSTEHVDSADDSPIFGAGPPAFRIQALTLLYIMCD